MLPHWTSHSIVQGSDNVRSDPFSWDAVRCKTKIKTLLENPLMDGASIAKKNHNPSCLVMHRRIKKKTDEMERGTYYKHHDTSICEHQYFVLWQGEMILVKIWPCKLGWLFEYIFASKICTRLCKSQNSLPNQLCNIILLLSHHVTSETNKVIILIKIFVFFCYQREKLPTCPYAVCSS